MSEFLNGPITDPLPQRLTPASATLIDGATIALDASLADHFVVTLGGNRTMGTPTNPKGGQRLTLQVVQDGAGARTLTFPAAFDFNGYTPALNAAASASTTMLFVYSGKSSKWVLINTPVVPGGLTAGILTADAPGRALFAADFFDAATYLAKFAAGSFTNTVFQKIAAAGAFGADAASRAAFAVGFFNAATTLSAFAAKAIAASLLEDGSATAGIAGPALRFKTSEAAGAMVKAPGVPVVLELSIADAITGNDDFTGLIGKYEILDCWVVASAGTDVGNTYKLQTSGGANDITNAMAMPAATSGSVIHAAVITKAGAVSIIASGGTIRVAHVKNAASAAAKVYILMVPVA